MSTSSKSTSDDYNPKNLPPLSFLTIDTPSQKRERPKLIPMLDLNLINQQKNDV